MAKKEASRDFVRRGFVEGSRTTLSVAAAASGSLSVLVDLVFRKLREGLVSLFFLSERCFQQLFGLIQAELRRQVFSVPYRAIS